MPWYDGRTLLAHLENVAVSGDRNLIDFRFPVQFVNRPHQNFRGFCGLVASGVVRTGEEVTVLPSGRRSRVSRIATFDGDREAAFAGQSVTLCLADEIDIGRGDMLCHPNNMPHATREAEAMVVWMSETPLQPGAPYVVKHTTQTLRGVFRRIHYRVDPNTLHRQDAARLGLNDIARVTIETFKPIFWDPYERNRATGSFIVIDPLTNGTLGAGMIIERLVQRAPDAGEQAGRNVRREASLVEASQRERLTGVRGVTLWLTGLSGAGKSTIAKALEQRLIADGRLACLLDGDNVRHGLNRDLGFDEADRRENIRRVAEVAALFNQAGVLAITAFISPYRGDREAARDVIGADRFIEVFVDAPLDVCEARDPKGLYRKARAAEIPSFTGVSAPYEAPEKPDLHVETSRIGAAEAVDAILSELARRGVFRAG